VSARLLRVAALVITAIVLTLALSELPAESQGGGSQYGSTKEKTAAGTITITAADIRWIASDGGTIGRSSGSGPICTYTPLGPTGTMLLGPGGARPGAWYIPTCQFRDGYVGNPMPAVWIGSTPSAPAANPRQLAQQAVADLALGGAHIEMSPPPTRPQIVNLQTWLWVSGAWRGTSATAAAGPVKAIATAIPDKVVWEMGDGHSVTCYGPGTVYDSNKPASGQSTTCSYLYRTPSSAAPGGRYTVTATIYYRVSWIARSAPGGGNLGLVAGPTARAAVVVEQAEALDTSGG
jgi:hypothetical protein